MSVKTNTLKTRIALRVDTENNWRNSSAVLYDGEIAIAYSDVVDLANRTVRKNVHIRVGTGYSIWNDCPELQAQEITDELKQQIVNELKSQFVSNDVFQAAISSLDTRVTALEQRSASRVKAVVDNELLTITKDD